MEGPLRENHVESQEGGMASLRGQFCRVNNGGSMASHDMDAHPPLSSFIPRAHGRGQHKTSSFLSGPEAKGGYMGVAPVTSLHNEQSPELPSNQSHPCGDVEQSPGIDRNHSGIFEAPSNGKSISIDRENVTPYDFLASKKMSAPASLKRRTSFAGLAPFPQATAAAGVSPGAGIAASAMMEDEVFRGAGEERFALAGQFDLAEYNRICRRANSEFKSKVKKNGATLFNRLTGIGPKCAGMPGSNLIHPLSPFSQLKVVISTLLLFYSAITSSINAGFYWTAPSCFKTPTLEIDMAVDLFFVIEIILHFFEGVYRQGQYHDDLFSVAKFYLMGGFWFDCLTSIPAAWLEFVNLKLYCTEIREDHLGDDPAIFGDDDSFRILRSVKPLKVFRMMKTLKAVAATNIGSIYGSSTAIMLSQTFRVPSFVLRVGQVLFLLSLLIHTSACMYWLVKSDSSSAANLADWMNEQNVDVDGKSDATLMEKYIVSVYFVFTIFTTVGFGDITPVNLEERVFIIVLFYMSMLGFGALLAEVQDAMMQRGRFLRMRSARISGMIDFLREKDTPPDLERRIITWMNFDLECQQQIDSANEIANALPPNLISQLQKHLNQKLSYISFLRDIQDSRKELFINEIENCTESSTYPALAPITSLGGHADRMFFIQVGQVNVVTDNGSLVSTLHTGDGFGEMALLGITSWTLGGELVQYITTSNTLVRYITADDFNAIVERFGGDLQKVFVRKKHQIFLRHSITLSSRSLASPNEGYDENHLVLLRWLQLKKRVLDAERRRNGRGESFELAISNIVLNSDVKGMLDQSYTGPAVMSSQILSPKGRAAARRNSMKSSERRPSRAPHEISPSEVIVPVSTGGTASQDLELEESLLEFCNKTTTTLAPARNLCSPPNQVATQADISALAAKLAEMKSLLESVAHAVGASNSAQATVDYGDIPPMPDAASAKRSVIWITGQAPTATEPDTKEPFLAEEMSSPGTKSGDPSKPSRSKSKRPSSGVARTSSKRRSKDDDPMVQLSKRKEGQEPHSASRQRGQREQKGMIGDVMTVVEGLQGFFPWKKEQVGKE